MDRTQLLQHFDTLAETPGAAAKLRDLVLEVAIQGRLSTQNAKDEPVSQLIARIKSRSAAADDARATRAKDSVNEQQLQAFWYPLPESWTTLPLGIVTNIVRGITFPSSAKGRIREPHTVACLRTTNVQAGIEWDDILFIPEKFVSREDQWLKPDDLVISMANSAALVGKVAQVRELPEKATFGGFLAVIRPIELDPRYLLFYLRAPSMQAAFRATSSQTTNIANISLGGMRPLPVAIPPLAEQRRIVAKVEELLALCDELEARQTAAREHRTHLVRSAYFHLTDSSSLIPSPRQSGAEAGHPSSFSDHVSFILHNSSLILSDVPSLRKAILSLAVRGRLGLRADRDNGDSVPSDWRQVTVGEAADHRLGKMLDHQKNCGAPRPYLRNTNVHWFRFELSTVKELRIEDEELENYELRRGDVLICEGGHGIGRTAVWESDEAGMIFQKALHRVRPGKNLDSHFFAFCMKVYSDDGILEKYFTGAGIPHLTGQSLGRLKFPLPPLAEQHRIVAKVDELMRWCDALEARLAAAQTTATHLLDASIHQILAA